MPEPLEPPSPYWADEDVTLYHGKCEDILPSLPENSVDAVVCDPPYDLTSGKSDAGGFMGQAWDATGVAFDPATWRAVMRVMKPGAYLLAFGGTRTWHRLVCAIEDAGFEIRDPIADLTGMDAPGLLWIQAQGYPKNLDVSKAIDKRRDDSAAIHRVTAFVAAARLRAGLTNGEIDKAFGFNGMAGHWTNTRGPQAAVPTWEQWQQLRTLIGFGDEMDAEAWRLNGRKGAPGEAWEQREVIGRWDSPGRGSRSPEQKFGLVNDSGDITAPATEDAARWEGWGTALKPAWEPIAVARKPLRGTVAQNVLGYGTGALNLAACKVGTEQRVNHAGGASSLQRVSRVEQGYRPAVTTSSNEDTEVDGRWPPNLVIGEEAAAELDRQSGASTSRIGQPRQSAKPGDGYGMTHTGAEYADSGGASRFFPVFKYEPKASASERPRLPDGTAWPTVKPVDLMRWLVRLVTPPGGTVGDFFLGTGPVAEACIIEGFPFIGIDQDERALRLTLERLSKPIQPVMLTVDDSAPAATARPVAASRPKPAPEAHPSLFDLEDAS